MSLLLPAGPDSIPDQYLRFIHHSVRSCGTHFVLFALIKLKNKRKNVALICHYVHTHSSAKLQFNQVIRMDYCLCSGIQTRGGGLELFLKYAPPSYNLVVI